MVRIRFEQIASVPPAVVLAAATDFSERRPELWSSWQLRVVPVRGGARVEWIADRVGIGFKGRLLTLMLRARGRALLAANLRHTLTLLEDLSWPGLPGRSEAEDGG